MIKLLGVFVFLFVFTSCYESLNNFEINTDAKYLIPVAHGSITVEELISSINSDSLLQSGNKNELVFVYENPSFMEFDLNDLIDFATYFELPSFKKSLGDINIDNQSLNETLSLGELKDKISNDEELNLLIDQTYSVFPAVSYTVSFDDAPEYQLPGSSLDFEEVTFSSGSIKFKLTNNLPVDFKGTFVIFDGKSFKETFDLGVQTSTGISPGNTDEVSFILDKKEISQPLYYKLMSASTTQSSNSVFIDFNSGLDIAVELNSLRISKGILNQKNLTIELPVDTFLVEPGVDVRITSAALESATMDLSLTKNFDERLSLDVEFLTISDNGNNLKCGIINNSVGQNTNQIGLNNIVMDLSSGVSGSNSVPYKVTFEISSDSNIQFDSEDFVDLSIQLLDLNVSSVKGDFGNQKMPFDGATIDLDLDIWEQINDNLVITDPVLKLIVGNPFGFPTIASVKAKGYNKKNETAEIEVNGIQLDYPKTEEEGYLSTDIIFDNANTDIGELLNLPPDSIINFSGELEINPPSLTTGENNNFINFEKTINLGYSIEVPIVLEGNLYTLNDTLSWLGSAFDSIQSPINITFRIINELPIGVNLNITPYNLINQSVTGEKMDFEPIKSAVTDDDGNMLEASETEFTKKLTVEQLESFRIADAVMVNSELLSPQNGTKPARLKPEYNLSFYVYLETGLKKEN